MDPIIRHRLILLACIIACCAVLSSFASDFLPTDRTTGFTLIFSHQGPLLAFATFAALLVPLTCIALIAAVSGTALSGVFVIGVSLCIFAAGFGPANGLLVHAELPHDYARLAMESAVLAALACVVGLTLAKATPPLKARLPWLTRFPDESASIDPITLPSTLASIATTVPVAAIVAYLLSVGDSPKQSIGAVIVAFTVGSAVALNSVGRRGLLGSLISPFVLALLVYLFTLLNPMGAHAFNRLWFTNQISGLDRILPIYYLAAGPVGTVLGLVIAGPLAAERPAPETKPA
jgi:hypothetical protein